MANIFQDLQHGAVFTAGNTFNSAISGTAGLTTVDMSDDVANRITAILGVTTISSSGNVTIKFQESSDASNWTDIVQPDGTTAAFTAASVVNTSQIVSFNISKRYVRGYGTLNSGTSINCVLLFLAQRKATPQNAAGGWVNEQYS